MINLFTKSSKSKGFTLIELLVVVSIIGLLASIVVVSLGGSRTQSRDAKRLADLKQIQNALELCYNDIACGATAVTTDYPGTGTATDTDTCAEVFAANSSALTKYMSTMPTDPVNSGTLIYNCLTIAQDYCLSADLENGTFVRISDTGTNQAASGACAAAGDK